MPLFRRPTRPAALLLAAALAAPLPAQETPPLEPDPMADPRPPVVAYTVRDGVGIPAPLTDAPGDPARGRALFADPRLGGCASCHGAPGVPRRDAVPRLLAERLPPLPPPPGPDATPEAEAPEIASDSPLAPPRAPLPAVRPGGDSPRGDASGDDAAPPLLPLPVGPDLAGIADRLSEAELRLTVVNPRIANPRTRMPAYHHVSLALAERAPALRQPWLSPRQVEDLVAYLATLDSESRAPGSRVPAPAPDP